MRLILSLLLILSWSSLAAQQIDVQHYDINLTINPPGDTIAGHTIVTATATGGALSEVTLNLLDLTASNVDVDGTPVTTFTQIGDQLIIPLPSPLNDGQSADIRVDYSGTPFQDPSGLGGWYQGNPTFNIGVGYTAEPPNLGRVWFPANDNFTDKATFDFRITTDTVNEAICGGTLVGTTDNGDGTETWTWRMDKPITTYNASVAVGDYGLYTEEYVSDLTGDTIPMTFYAPVSGMGNVSQVPSRVGMLEPALQIFETYYGPYPQDRIGYIAVGDFPAAMEHVENIAMPRLLLQVGGYESVYVHELSHMWWGGNVNCASAQDMWLNEGIATFSESLFYEERDGEAAGRDYRRENYLLTSIFEAHVDDSGYHALSGLQNPQPASVVYGTTNYYKGAAVVHTLRKYMGDAVFFDAMKSVQSTLAPQAIDSEEFRAALEASSG
ncbi:MAG: M1 family metallopeptidase, partial [Bacteroidota bacterium]